MVLKSECQTENVSSKSSVPPDDKIVGAVSAVFISSTFRIAATCGQSINSAAFEEKALQKQSKQCQNMICKLPMDDVCLCQSVDQLKPFSACQKCVNITAFIV